MLQGDWSDNMLPTIECDWRIFESLHIIDYSILTSGHVQGVDANEERVVFYVKELVDVSVTLNCISEVVKQLVLQQHAL